MDYSKFIGQQVVKSCASKSSKPFKSGRKINTVKGITDHPFLEGEKGFTFEEDDSIVLCAQCQLSDTVGKTTSMTHKKNALDKMPNEDAKKSCIFGWVITGQCDREELWELVAHINANISNNRIRKINMGGIHSEDFMVA
jgi:hypothetical protein